jgi:hypothetical protein
MQENRSPDLDLFKKIPALSVERLVSIATEDESVCADDVKLAAWGELAKRGVDVEFVDPNPTLPNPSEILITAATFRNYIQAQFAQTRLLSSGIQAFLFDDNLIRLDWFLATALGFVKLRVRLEDIAETLEILAND